MSAKLVIDADETLVNRQDIETAVTSAGYELDDDTPLLSQSFRLINFNREKEKALRKALEEESPVKEFKINRTENKINLVYEKDQLNIQDLFKGMDIQTEPISNQYEPPKSLLSKNRRALFFTGVSGLLALSGIILQHAMPSHILSMILFYVAVFIGGHPIARQGLKEARQLRLGMNFLMSIAVIGALVIGELSEAAIVVFLFSLAELLESLTIQRARQSLESLMNLTPETALLKSGNSFIEKSVHDISVGQVILIKPGQRIPLDGTVVEGNSAVNQAPITGESLPLEKTAGDTVFAGTLNQYGSLQVQVSKRFEDSTLARIIHLVEEAQVQRAPVQKIVDKFAGYYTPAMVLMAGLILLIPTLFLGGAFDVWFYRALVLLVISCPCALVISTPVTLVSALTTAFRNGILIKGGMYLEKFSRIDALAFDKTGTLTHGKPAVTSLIPMNGYNESEILQIARTIELQSEHALADAIVQYAESREAASLTARDFRIFTGMGATANIDGTTYHIANHRYFEEKGWCNEQVHEHLWEIENQRNTAVILSREQEVIAIFSISDAIRTEAPRVLKALKKLGLSKLLMLTGDNKITAGAIAEKLGIDQYFAELLPADKVTTIQKLKEEHEVVGMVGDGINDAPALATATIGISMGASGSDTAIETADISLMTDNLEHIVYLRFLSEKTVRIIKQNIFISLFLKAIFFALAIPGLATLWMAVFADMGASLIVIFNGMRALSVKTKPPTD
jgi:Cd2+/Zn2+-exporting ATPase